MADNSGFVELYTAVSRDNVNQINIRRFNKNITIHDLKCRLELATGVMANSMLLTLLDCENQEKCKLTDDDETLESYPVSNGDVLLAEGPQYVESADNPDERYQLSTEEYDTRKGTLKEYLMKNKLGPYHPKYLKTMTGEEKHELLEKEEKAFESINVGERCEVIIPGKPIYRGTVMYKGKIKSRDGLWIGVKYDEPYGDSNGTSNGVKYFEAHPKYGGFVKPSCVTTGDFPETCELDVESDDEF